MLRFKVSENTVKMDVESSSINMSVTNVAVMYMEELEAYEGSYAVTPKVDEQTLLTKDKKMTDDLTVKAIPYFDTGNNSGGRTIYIGNEV